MSTRNQEPVYGFRKPTEGPVRTPVRRVSKKRAKQNAEYSKKRKAFLELHPFCMVWLAINGVDECAAIDAGGRVLLGLTWANAPVSTEIHHKRGRTGLRLLEEEFWLAVSREGHNWIHNNPKMAYERGFMIKR